MRSFALVVALALAGCAAGGTYQPPGGSIEEFDRRTAALRISNPELFTGRPISPPPTQEERLKAEADRQKMEVERIKRDREDALLERAFTGSPDYMAALRRAAVANVDVEEAPAPTGRRNLAAQAQAREQRIAAEEARLSDAVEARRRSRLAQQDQNDRMARANAARAACDAQASSVGAGIYTPYSPRAGILGSALTGAIASASAEEQARAGCYRAYGL